MYTCPKSAVQTKISRKPHQPAGLDDTLLIKFIQFSPIAFFV